MYLFHLLVNTSIASSVILVTSHPAFVAIISYFLWGERLNKLTMGGIIFAMAGVAVINYNRLTLKTFPHSPDMFLAVSFHK